MTIVHLIFSFNVGGAEQLLIDIMNEQSKTENVYLIIINKSYNKFLLKNLSERVTVHCINRKRRTKNIIPIIRLNLLINKIKPDVIHCHSYEIIAVLYFRRTKIKCFLTLHGVNICTKFHHKYDKIFSISNSVRTNLLQNKNINSVVVRNGINFSKVNKKKYKLRNKTFKIVQIGRLDHGAKGQDILINAVKILWDKYSLNHIEIILIGEGESYTYLKNKVAELGMGNVISFLGFKDRNYVYSNLFKYDLLVQPSIREGFGLTVIEAIAAGVPVLVSNKYGPMEIIEHGKYGEFFVNKDANDCAEKIKFIIDNYEEIYEKTKKAYSYFYSTYSIQFTSQKYLAEYVL